MIEEGYDLIRDYIAGMLGEYQPIVLESGEVCIDWTYIFAGVAFLIALWFCFRGLLILLKGVLGSYV